MCSTSPKRAIGAASSSRAILESSPASRCLAASSRARHANRACDSVCHFPPGTSKWKQIEHRLWSFISKNWRGEPLISYAVIINLIAATTTTSGLEVYARLDQRSYPKVEVSAAQLTAVNFTGDKFHPDWNYTIRPLAATETQR
jgi:hypothetical protein